MNKYIWRSAFVLTLCALIMSCSEDLSVSYLKLEECIREAESLITNTQEGIEEGNIAPGSKKSLQKQIDWAYFILENSGRDEAYENAFLLLQKDIEIFHANVVSSGIPLFGFGAKMNLGLAEMWQMEESFSIECRVYYTEFAPGDQNIVSCEGNGKGWMLRSSGNKIQFYIQQNGWNGLSTSPLELNRWYHIAATYYKNGNISLYLDGVKVGSAACKELSISNQVDLQIGTSPSYADRYMRGYIQDFSIWSDVRTEEEIATDINGGFGGTEEGLKAYWPLNLNVGTDILDKTGTYTATTAGIIWQKMIE